MSVVNLSLKEASRLSETCLLNNGFDSENAKTIAARMIQAERDLCPSHGLFRMPLTVKGITTKRVNGQAKPKLKKIAPAVIRVDCDSGYVALGQKLGHEALVDCARENGIAALALVNMFHIAAMWPEVEALANEGLCAFAFTASYPYVAPAGGIKPLYGTNPIGFAWPRPDGPPLVFDQASSAMARGEIQLAARDGEKVPETAGIDKDGNPSTDPNAILEGAQLGFGGYKGASMAMMIELISGPLIGEFLSFEAEQDDQGKGGPPKGGELIIAMDPKMFGNPEGFLAHGEKLFEKIIAQEGTRLPSQRRFAGREYTAKHGIEIPQSLYDEILALSDV